MAVQLHDQRVHQEGHIVGDHLNDRVGGLPAVLLEARVVDPQLELGGPPLPQQAEVRECGAVEVRYLALTEVLGRHAGVVTADEGLDPPAWRAGRRSRASAATASMTSSFFCSGERTVMVMFGLTPPSFCATTSTRLTVPVLHGHGQRVMMHW